MGRKLKDSEKIKFKKILKKNKLTRKKWCYNMGFGVNDVAQIMAFDGRKVKDHSKYYVAIMNVINSGEVKNE